MKAYPRLACPAFKQLRGEIERHPRLCGHYLLDLVEIPGFPEDDCDREVLLDALFEQFDDQVWPPPSQRPPGENWSDYACRREVAEAEVVAALVGGPEIGHTVVTMPPETARELWLRFESLFDAPRRYYACMSFGNRDYVFSYGVVVIDVRKAGILWVVEGD